MQLQQQQLRSSLLNHLCVCAFAVVGRKHEEDKLALQQQHENEVPLIAFTSHCSHASHSSTSSTSDVSPVWLRSSCLVLGTRVLNGMPRPLRWLLVLHAAGRAAGRAAAGARAARARARGTPSRGARAPHRAGRAAPRRYCCCSLRCL